MNEFESLEQLNQVFQTGRFTLPDEMMVAGLPYHYSKSVAHTIPEMKEGKKLFVIYAVAPHIKQSEEWKTIVEERTMQEWIILIWALDGTLSVRPARAVTNTAARAKTDLQFADKNLREGNSNIVADTVQIKFTQFNKQVPGKVDTGANLSSLHCDEWKVDSGKNIVEFRCSLLSENTIRTELLDQAVIKTSEGSEYRPVIALSVVINGKDLQNCKFNLNDRSHMQDKILVGQNILEQGKFLVDPNKQANSFEDVDWDALQELYKDVEVIEEEQLNPKLVDAVAHAFDLYNKDQEK